MTDFFVFLFIVAGSAIVLRMVASLVVLAYRSLTIGLAGGGRSQETMAAAQPRSGPIARRQLSRLQQENAGLKTALARAETTRRQLEAQLAEAQAAEPIGGGDLQRIRKAVVRELHPDQNMDKPEALRRSLEEIFKRLWPLLQPKPDVRQGAGRTAPTAGE